MGRPKQPSKRRYDRANQCYVYGADEGHVRRADTLYVWSAIPPHYGIIPVEGHVGRCTSLNAAKLATERYLSKPPIPVATCVLCHTEMCGTVEWAGDPDYFWKAEQSWYTAMVTSPVGLGFIMAPVCAACWRDDHWVRAYISYKQVPKETIT